MVNFDTILDPVRLWIARRAAVAGQIADDEGSAGREAAARVARRRQGRWNLLIEFFGCPWCVGLWLALAGAAVVVAVLDWPWLTLLPVGLACSYLVGLAAPVTADEMEIVDDNGEG